MRTQSEMNKAIVIRFNRECIEQGNPQAFRELLGEDTVNHAAPPGAPNGPDSMAHFILEVLRKGFTDIRVDIHDQVAEGDKVTTRKTLWAKHTGTFMGVPASNREVAIKVIDIVRVKDGKYAEHWGLSNLAEILPGLRG